MTTPAAAPKRRSLVPGILLGVLAVLLIGVGGVVYGVAALFAPGTYTQIVEIPNPIQDDFEAGRYSILLDDDSVADESDPVSLLVCTIENGGETQEVKGADLGGFSTETNGDELIGDFTAKAGPTTVTCDFASGRESTDYFYFVQPAAPAAPVATIVLLALGGILLLGAAALILRAVFSRRSRA
ncbi:MAG: hypothetical protein ABIQ01_01280 [Pseudolysinimonas sp.]